MGFGSCICKCLLILINLIFILIGLAIMAAGILIKVGKSLVQPQLDGLLKELGSISSGVNIAGAASAPPDTSALVEDILAYGDAIAIGLIAFGCFMFVLGCLGSCGACCVVKCMLITYIVVVFVVLLVQVIVVGLLFSGKFNKQLRTQMKKTIDEDFVGFDDFSPASLLWNFVMAFFKCCGLDNYKDFSTATKWKKDRQFTVGGTTHTYTMTTPLMCCKMDGTFPQVTPKDSNCNRTPNDTISNWNTGCWTAVGNEITTYRTAGIGACAGIFVFELLLGVLAIILLAIENNKDKVGVV